MSLGLDDFLNYFFGNFLPLILFFLSGIILIECWTSWVDSPIFLFFSFLFPIFLPSSFFLEISSTVSPKPLLKSFLFCFYHFNHFKLLHSVALSTFTILYNHHQYAFLELFHHLKQKLHTHEKLTPYFSHPIPQ